MFVLILSILKMLFLSDPCAHGVRSLGRPLSICISLSVFQYVSMVADLVLEDELDQIELGLGPWVSGRGCVA